MIVIKKCWSQLKLGEKTINWKYSWYPEKCLDIKPDKHQSNNSQQSSEDLCHREKISPRNEHLKCNSLLIRQQLVNQEQEKTKKHEHTNICTEKKLEIHFENISKNPKILIHTGVCNNIMYKYCGWP